MSNTDPESTVPSAASGDAEGRLRRPGGGAGEERELSPEELLEQIKQLRIADLLLSTLSTTAQLGYAKLEGGELDQTKLAIEALAALLPVLEGDIPAEVGRDFHQVLANLQLAYAKAVGARAPAETAEAPPPDA